jgi:hypothetical protein
MRHRLPWAVLCTLCLAHPGCGASSPANPAGEELIDYRAGLRSVLVTLRDQADEPLLRLHFNSVLQVVAAGDRGVLLLEAQISDTQSGLAVQAVSGEGWVPIAPGTEGGLVGRGIAIRYRPLHGYIDRGP